MYQLTSIDLLSLNGLTLFLLIGIVFFIGAVMLMIFLFSWSLKETKQKAGGLLVLLIFSMAVPLTAAQVGRRQDTKASAAEFVRITHLEIVPIDQKTVLVSMTTSLPVQVGLRFKDEGSSPERIVLANRVSEDQQEHDFLIDNLSSKGGKATLLVNGKEFLINGEPLSILPGNS